MRLELCAARADVAGNRITKIEGLDSLVALEELYLSHNGITKVEGLRFNVCNHFSVAS